MAANVFLNNQKWQIIEHNDKKENLYLLLNPYIFVRVNKLSLHGHCEFGSLKHDNIREDCLFGIFKNVYRNLLSFTSRITFLWIY